MEFQIVRLLKDFAEAERARDDLATAGFGRDCVRLEVFKDEAGPPQGNFTVGDDPAVTGGGDYSKTFAPKPAAEQESCLITVIAADQAQAEQADIILGLHGATDIDMARQAAERAVPGQS